MEYPLEDKHGERKKKCVAVKDTACKHFSGGTHGGGKKGHEEVTQGGKQYAPGESGKDDKRKKDGSLFLVCPSPMVFATRALPPEPNMNPTQAKTMMAGKIRLTAVNAVFAHIVRYEKSVDHGVGGNKDHHYHGGQDETEKTVHN